MKKRVLASRTSIGAARWHSRHRKVMTFYEEVGRRIRKVREVAPGRDRKGWSQAQLAEAIGVERATMNRYENGTPVSLDVLIRISRVLNVALTSLLDVGAPLPEPAPKKAPPKPKRPPTTKKADAQILKIWRELTPRNRQIAMVVLSEMQSLVGAPRKKSARRK